MRKPIRVTIVDNASYERDEDFKIELFDIKGPLIDDPEKTHK